jgi:hypothetical protein
VSALIIGAVSAVCRLTWLGCNRYGVRSVADLDRLASVLTGATECGAVAAGPLSGVIGT